MTEDYSYINFIASIQPLKEISREDLCFVFYKDKMLFIKEVDGIDIPIRQVIETLSMEISKIHYLGLFYGANCYVYQLSSLPLLPETMSFIGLKSSGAIIGEEKLIICGKASQILHWEETNRYCGRCGSKTVESNRERAKICTECGLAHYPRISPAVITAITKGDEILLAHNNNFPEGIYSLIAGFVEPGESFEDCVKREIVEEVGIRVKNINYFSSQPWPFPNSLMIGFTAEYEAGEIAPDGIEIGDAGWFKLDALPNLPSKISIARKIIESFL